MENDKVEPAEPGKVVMTNQAVAKNPGNKRTPGQDEREKRNWLKEHKLNG